ncbi:MAG: MmcQ/YjbR family DNA-binding protein [Marinosulfonomonas sp.]|nr:MmcQ/YjbR family DNA-binding protein [Marinosulfonomonas sp.]
MRQLQRCYAGIPVRGGPNVWKVGNKIFAITGAPNGVSLECADAPTADLLIDMNRAKKAPYLPRGGWVLIEWNTMQADEVAERLARSTPQCAPA